MLIIAAILVILLSVKVKGKVSFHHNCIKAAVTWFAVPLIKKEFEIRRKEDKFLTLFAVEKKGKKIEISLKEVIRLSAPKKDKKTNTKEALNYLHSKAAYDIAIKLKIGTGDALLTALLSGLMNIIFGTLFAMRENKKIVLKTSIVPEFSKQALCLDANCIIKVSPVHIMIGYMIFKKLIRR